MVSKSFFALRDLVGSSGTFGCFAICNLAAAAFVACLVPETRGKTLTEIQKMYVVGAEKLLDKDDADVDKQVKEQVVKNCDDQDEAGTVYDVLVLPVTRT